MAKAKPSKGGKTPTTIVMMTAPSAPRRAARAVAKGAKTVRKAVSRKYNSAKGYVKMANERFNAKSFARRTVFAGAGGIASSVVSVAAKATSNTYDDSILVQSGARLLVAAAVEYLIPGENARTFTAGWTGDGAGRAFDAGMAKLAKG